MGKLDGKKALITGGQRGLGFEIAKEYVRQGADIFICARSGDALQTAAAELSALKVRADQIISYKKADVSNASDMDVLFDSVMQEFDGNLDVLVNNAGIQGPIGALEENDWDELIKVININLVGALYCMRKAVVIFKEEAKKNGSGSKSIINISGGGATGPRPYFMGYAVAKTGIVRATETLAKEVKPYNIRVNAIAPGAMNTRMMDEILSAGDRAGEEYEKILQKKNNGSDSMDKPAKLAAYLASDDSAFVTGKLISAVWDGWQDFEKHEGDIAESDIFTLRRIVPKDRGFDWE